MDDYAGRVLADRYRLPRPPADEVDFAETRAFDTYSGQEVLIRQIPLPEVVEAEFAGADGDYGRYGQYGPGTPGSSGASGASGASGRMTRSPADPAVRRALEAATAAAAVPDHPRLDQVFDVFAEDGGLWIVSELVRGRPLAALLAERTLTPHRAAEVAADVLTALCALHAHGWIHRNITARTVLVCEDGRAMLTGLAVGAAEEALCGYDPTPPPPDQGPGPDDGPGRGPSPDAGAGPDGGGAGTGGGNGHDGPRPGGAAPGGGAPGGAAPGVSSYYSDPAASAGGTDLDRAAARPGGGPPAEPDGRALGGPPGTGSGPAPGAWELGFGPGADRTGADRTGLDGSDGARPGADGGRAGSAPGDGRQPRVRAIAAYSAGARAAARASVPPGPETGTGRAALPGGPRTAAGGGASALPGLPDGWQPAGGQSAPHRDPARGRGEVAGAVTDGSQQGFPALPGRADAPPAPYGDAGPAAGVPAEAGWHGSTGRPGHPGLPPASPGDGHGHGNGHGDGHGDGGQGRPPAQRDGGAPDQDRLPPGGPPSDGRPSRGTAAPHPDPDSDSAQRPGPDVETGHDPARSPDGAPPTDRHRTAGSTPGRTPDGAAGGTPDRTAAPAPAAAGAPRWPAVERPPVRPGASDRQPAVPGQPAGSRWDDLGGGRSGVPQHGPATPLAAERARQARILVVGAVTERWAPEQAGPVHGNWQLAPPVGPATDLWAIGALLFRAVQGHAPYPEESAAELVQLVCAEAPAFAEECGALRPVVESLLRQDPAERPEFEELRGWLRSLIRTAPEPDVGSRTVTVPSLGPGGSAVSGRLPVLRRRGELVRRRRAAQAGGHGRHKKARTAKSVKSPQTPQRPQREQRAQEPQETQEAQGAKRSGRGPRSLGRLLLLLILLALAAAVAYAVLFMPRAGETGQGTGADRTGSAGAASSAPGDESDESDEDGAAGEEGGSAQGGGDEPPISESPQTAQPGDSADLAKGFELRDDPEGFRIAVHEDWKRRGENSLGQVRYARGEFELTVVPGRDTVEEFGGDPMAYQQDSELELDPFRDSQWSSASGLRRIEVGNTSMAEGAFSWQDSSGREVHTRNLAMILNGRYHVVLVTGPVADKQEVTRFFEQATATYRTLD